MQVKERIAAFRKRMTEQGIAVAIVPTADSHASEYLADHFKVRQWLCGFTGSAGTLVVAREEAALFTDGRYFIQAQNQLAGSGVELMRMGTAGTPSLEAYVDALTQAGDTVGVDFSVISAQFAQAMRGRLEKRGVKLADTGDWFDALWTDRPPMPQQKAFLLEEGYAGRSVQSKLEAIRGEMKRQGAAVHVCNVLDDIAWTLNVRGGDVLYTPVVMSYLVVGEQDAAWFVEESKVEDALRAALCEAGVAVRGYGEITDALSRLAPGTRVLADGRKLTAALMAALAHTEVVQHENPAMRIKAHKNEVELANLRRAHVKDGLAVTHLMYWLKTRVGKEPMTERSVSDRLLALRAEQENFISPSFSTICAYRDHAAMMHYSATPETDVPLEPRDLLLIDSGGQYLEGTTDITRTFALGPVEHEQKKHFTAVLCGMLALANAKFLHGVTGIGLDILARGPMWDLGIDYRCGTGHGVGYLLSVHEGPNSFRWYKSATRSEDTVLDEGMVTTDEPGIYIEGSHGIRTENELVCRRLEENEYGQFMGFEVITCAPIDLDAVLPEEMSPRQREQLNAYHAFVRETLLPYMEDAGEREWLIHATRAIG
ncbi:MAG TPA: aminopeptidase P family protein [Candidatus Ventricola intestinavium]|nr:aminopeptidase P family protein [Candidatus Ventricola intestinavium]